MLNNITVSIDNDHGKIRLRIKRPSGERISLSLRLPYNQQYLNYAKQIKYKLIQSYLDGKFDEVLSQYKSNQPKTLKLTEISIPLLFEEFIKQKEKENLASNTLVSYKNILTHLKSKLNTPANSLTLNMSEKFITYLEEINEPSTVVRYFSLIKACWKWAKKAGYQVTDPSPWDEIVTKKEKPKQPVDPFTQVEVTAIIEGFAQHPTYSHYTDYVIFLFNVGCRPGEAAGLKWKHISKDYKSIWIGESVSRGERSSTKTNKARTIYLSPKIQELLKKRYSDHNLEDLVFPTDQRSEKSTNGQEINDQYFRESIWTNVLNLVGIPYKKPYATRHTAISHNLSQGIDPFFVARQAGHDYQMMIKHYASYIPQGQTFVEL